MSPVGEEVEEDVGEVEDDAVTVIVVGFVEPAVVTQLQTRKLTRFSSREKAAQEHKYD